MGARGRADSRGRHQLLSPGERCRDSDSPPPNRPAPPPRPLCPAPPPRPLSQPPPNFPLLRLERPTWNVAAPKPPLRRPLILNLNRAQALLYHALLLDDLDGPGGGRDGGGGGGGGGAAGPEPSPCPAEAREPLEGAYGRLVAADPAAAARLHPNDARKAAR